MAPRLPEGALRDIAAVIALLPPELPVSRGDAAMIAGIICGREVTRQTIWASAEIKRTLLQHDSLHDAWRTGGGTPAPRTPLQAARDTIRELRAEIAARDKVLDQYLEMMARLMTNSLDKGLREEDLEAPLPKVTRGAARGSLDKWRRTLALAKGRR